MGFIGSLREGSSRGVWGLGVKGVQFLVLGFTLNPKPQISLAHKQIEGLEPGKNGLGFRVSAGEGRP